MKITPRQFNLTGNDLKDKVQEQAVEIHREYKKVLYKCYVGFGKTNIGKLILKDFDESKSNGYPVYVICPGSVTEMWTEILETYLGNRVPYEVHTINSYVIKDKTKEWKTSLLIVDECHRILNKFSEYFSTVLKRTDAEGIVLLSGSINEYHRKFLVEHGIETTFEVTKLWGYKNGLVPQYTIVNIPIKFTLQEMSDYLKAQLQYEKAEKYLATGGIYDAYTPMKMDNPLITNAAADLEVEPGQIIGMLRKLQFAINDRRRLLYNAQNKMNIVVAMLEALPEQAFVYCKSIDFANNIETNVKTAISVNSKSPKKKMSYAKLMFDTEVFLHLVSVDQLKEAINFPKCRIAIRTAFTSASADTEQVGGRVIRLDVDNPDKEAFLFHLFVEDFTANGREVKSQEKAWLKMNLKEEKQVIYLKSALEGIEYIKKLSNNEV